MILDPQDLPPTPPHARCYMSEEETEKISQVIDKLQEKHVIQEFHAAPSFKSTVFSRPKPDGSVRLILNLKKFNKHIEYKKFKMETLASVLLLVTFGCFMASLDLRDAYFTVPIAGQSVGFLCFDWRGRTFCFICLPNGLSSAPRLYTKLLKPVLAHLRKQGVVIAIYLDDPTPHTESFIICRVLGGIHDKSINRIVLDIPSSLSRVPSFDLAVTSLISGLRGKVTLRRVTRLGCSR